MPLSTSFLGTQVLRWLVREGGGGGGGSAALRSSFPGTQGLRGLVWGVSSYLMSAAAVSLGLRQ